VSTEGGRGDHGACARVRECARVQGCEGARSRARACGDMRSWARIARLPEGKVKPKAESTVPERHSVHRPLPSTPRRRDRIIVPS
jgi:hypothetical protein